MAELPLLPGLPAGFKFSAGVELEFVGSVAWTKRGPRQASPSQGAASTSLRARPWKAG